MSFEITWENHGAYKRFSGFVAFEEYARSQQMVLGDERTDDLHYIINDLSAIEGYSGTREQAEYLAAFNHGASLSNPRIRIAYVTSDLRIIALIGVASLLSSYELKAFPTLDQARAWANSAPPLYWRPGNGPALQ